MLILKIFNIILAISYFVGAGLIAFDYIKPTKYSIICVYLIAAVSFLNFALK